MEREVIRKYKEAFNWWLNGGKVWCRSKYEKGWTLLDNPLFIKGYIFIPADSKADERKAWYDRTPIYTIKNIKEMIKYCKEQIKSCTNNLCKGRHLMLQRMLEDLLKYKEKENK